MMSSPPTYLRNHQRLVDAFGYWPGFHDARAIGFSRQSSDVQLTLHAWEMTDEVDVGGCFILTKHHRVLFGFHVVFDAQLDEFVTPNILFELVLSSSEDFSANGYFEVGLNSAMGSELCGSFSARSAEVIQVIPCDESGKVALGTQREVVAKIP